MPLRDWFSILPLTFVSSGPAICYAVAFPLLGVSDHVVVSFSTDFPKQDEKLEGCAFHCTVFDYSHTDWNDLCDDLRHALWGAYLSIGLKYLSISSRHASTCSQKLFETVKFD